MSAPSPEAVAAVVRDRPGCVWLDGPERTLLAWEPEEICTTGDWREAGRAWVRDAPVCEGMVAGFVGYGAGHRVESVPAEGPVPEGECFLARYPGVLVWQDGRWSLGGSAAFRRAAEQALAEARPLPSPARSRCGPARTVQRASWLAAVDTVRELLHAGDAYQISLTRPVWVEAPPPAWEVYRHLRRAVAAYGAWLALAPDVRVLSNSPELLLHHTGDLVRTDPVKGTRPRHADPAADRALAEALRTADKDHAELTMIVDLVRNDLGRVCAPGSVRAAARRVTSHPSVHHTSQPVEGRLASGRDGFDALAALFPPGSVTGAPKVAACGHIAALEAHPRGVYCGAIGYATASEARWNVAIRTAVHTGGAARYHVGGGIVVDSDPADEWRETEHKARALAAAFGHGPVADGQARRAV